MHRHITAPSRSKPSRNITPTCRIEAEVTLPRQLSACALVGYVVGVVVSYGLNSHQAFARRS